MKNNINKHLKKCLIYGQRPFAPSAANPYNFLKFIRKINVKYLMNNNKNSIIDNNIIYTFILYIIIVYKKLGEKIFILNYT